VIDEEFARRYWPDSDPVGQQFKFWNDAPVTVVGVVRRVKMEGLSTDSNRVQAYFPYPQNPGGSMSIVARTQGDPISLANGARQQVLAIDRDQPVFGMQTMGEIWDTSIAPDRLNLMLLAIFASVALVLAAVGIYGVMAYSVTQRTHEIGIRMALGAGAGDVLKLVARQGLTLVFAGIALGLIGAFALTRVAARLLFEVSATDPLTFLSVRALRLAVAALACWLPARRATKVDPLVALRQE